MIVSSPGSRGDPGHARPVHHLGFVSLLILMWMGLGCAPATLHERGRLELKQNRPDAAVEWLRQAAEDQPDDPDVLRDLGVAHYQAAQYGEAVGALSRALDLRSQDGEVMFYLGASHERLGQVDAAITTYQRFTELPALPILGDAFRGKVAGRLRQLLDQRAETFIRQQMALEQGGALAEPAEGTMAVLPLTPTTSELGSAEDEAALAAALADWITTDLAKIRSQRLVERARLDVLLRELAWAESGAVDEASGPRVGRLLGAAALVGGSLSSLGQDQLMAQVSVYDVGTAQRQAAYAAQRPREEIFELEKDIVFGLIESMGIPLSDLERREIELVPTRNLSAFLSYGRGLLAQRRGEINEARIAYQEAFDEDPSFGMAFQALSGLGEAHTLDGLTTTLDEFRAAPGGGDIEIAADSDVNDRLEETDGLTGGDFWPDDPRETRPWVQADEIPDPPELPERSRP